MTLQEMFDISSSHLLSQMKQSMKRGVCQYRGDKGLKCALGVFITDGHYNPALDENAAYLEFDMENTDPLLLDVISKSLEQTLTEKEFSLLRDLQHVHDDNLPSEWEKELKRVAQMFDLNWNVESPIDKDRLS